MSIVLEKADQSLFTVIVLLASAKVVKLIVHKLWWHCGQCVVSSSRQYMIEFLADARPNHAVKTHAYTHHEVGIYIVIIKYIVSFLVLGYAWYRHCKFQVGSLCIDMHAL